MANLDINESSRRSAAEACAACSMAAWLERLALIALGSNAGLSLDEIGRMFAADGQAPSIASCSHGMSYVPAAAGGRGRSPHASQAPVIDPLDS